MSEKVIKAIADSEISIKRISSKMNLLGLYINYHTLYRIAKGKQEPTERQIEDLAKVLNKKKEDLI